MTEKTTPQRLAIVTGATSGLGYQMVRQLALLNWRVIGVARSPVRGRQMIEVLRVETGNPAIFFQAADLSSVQETLAVGELLARQYPKIDLLINNAGGLFYTRSETAEGIEQSFALNHLGYAALTKTLRPALESAEKARIINVTSMAHYGATLDMDNLVRESGWKQYQRTKLMNILFTRHLANLLPGHVTANCVHPGFVKTRFGLDNAGWWQRHVMKLMMAISAIPPALAAEGVLEVALSPDFDGVSGYFFDRGRPATPSPLAQDDALAAKLWQKTEEYLNQIPNTPT